ncbi:MAG: GDP-mannose 4,6-dehydratase [Acidobacteriaceae bacterium]|nr:GDP-mannose 4,6-dehydratase [Acidobacteriaceae bacterium]
MRNQFVLITGGAGFIGTNLALSYLAENRPVHIFDNLSRSGVERNVQELLDLYPGRVLFTQADVRDRPAVKAAIASARIVYHLAAQVAVTTSLEDPMGDVDTNLFGTLNVLEAIRACSQRPSLLFTSTNKVYGRLSGVPLREGARCYEPVDQHAAQAGAGEEQPLEFLSPYGCSKGAADQYVLDYAHSYGLAATVFRMSCIYGPHQLGSEDQGWVAHFVRQTMKEEPVTIYGDGKQVRDLLFVKDLVQAMRRAQENVAAAAGQAFNVGGGAPNSISLLELVDELKQLTGASPKIAWGAERPADQKWFVSNCSKIGDLLSWKPATPVRRGLTLLHEWYLKRPELIRQSQRDMAAMQVAGCA